VLFAHRCPGERRGEWNRRNLGLRSGRALQIELGLEATRDLALVRLSKIVRQSFVDEASIDSAKSPSRSIHLAGADVVERILEGLSAHRGAVYSNKRSSVGSPRLRIAGRSLLRSTTPASRISLAGPCTAAPSPAGPELTARNASFAAMSLITTLLAQAHGDEVPLTATLAWFLTASPVLRTAVLDRIVVHSGTLADDLTFERPSESLSR